MTSTTAHITEFQRRQLRELNAEYRDINETINHAQASVDRAKKLHDISYHRDEKRSSPTAMDTTRN
jgi:hypothetical protein